MLSYSRIQVLLTYIFHLPFWDIIYHSLVLACVITNYTKLITKGWEILSFPNARSMHVHVGFTVDPKYGYIFRLVIYVNKYHGSYIIIWSLRNRCARKEQFLSFDLFNKSGFSFYEKTYLSSCVCNIFCVTI